MQTLKRRLLWGTTLFNGFLLIALWALTSPQHHVAVVIAVLITAIGEFIGLWWLMARQERVLRDITGQVLHLNDPAKTHRLLLPPNHAYADLTQAINMAADELRHQNHVFQRQESELDSLLEYLPVGVIAIDWRRQTQLLNPMAAQLLEIASTPIPHPYTVDVQQYALTEQIETTLREHTNRRQTLTLTLPAATRTLEVSTLYNQPRPHHEQVLVLLYDLTEVTQIEQMQLDFVSNASHELKTPLTAIAGFTETLLNGAQNDPETRQEFLKIIDEQSHQLMDLIEDVLSVSRLQNPQRRTTTPVAVNLSELVAAQLKLQGQSIDRRELMVINDIPAGTIVMSDAGMLTQIVKNLLSNAIKYNHQQGTIRFGLTTTSTGNWQLQVKDTGYGMTPAQQARIFERFYRAELSHTKQRVPGTGLGLAIVKELVELLGGTVGVQSQPDVGTTMTVSFPK
ncbi:sensor histidine kinase [Furfurilactobacillus sp. WILCCON 0119]|uniref:sensor histidine kinase n=1 Tax=Furfurilactobacillus entadae TaxID=2922307 RepID=UPI0035E6D7DA